MKQFNRAQRRAALVLAAVFLILLFPVPAQAAVYTYNTGTATLTFEAITGSIVGCNAEAESVDIPEKIMGITVTTIGEEAFVGCNKLLSVTIPSTVTTIERFAFRFCKSLIGIDIPDSVTEIEDRAFEWSGLRAIRIPGSVKELEGDVFGSCKGLRKVILEEGIERASGTFCENCTSLTEITFPDSIVSIEDAQISIKTSGLKKITFGSGLESLECRSGWWLFDDAVDVYFRGDAPELLNPGNFFSSESAGTIYYPEGASGWTTPLWYGYVTQPYTLEPEPEPEPEPSGQPFHVNSVTISSGDTPLSVIPAGDFLTTVSITSQSAGESGTLCLACFTADGQYRGVLYVKARDLPSGATFELTIPVGNASGDIQQLKAFMVSSFTDCIPVSGVVSYPA